MSNYWTKRFEEEEKQRNISNKAYAKEIEKQYKIAENKIKSDIEKWYIRIADNNQISLADAKKSLTKDELKEFKWTLAEYTQKAKSGAWKKELENASARIHIKRLEALQLQVQNSIETLRNKENEMLEDYLIKNYEDTYYHSLYEISKGLNLKTSFATLDKNKINQVIGKPWLKDGKNFSDRIWQDKEQLINTLRTKITQSFITSSTLDEAVEDISKFISDKIKNKEYVARRLLETESAAYASKAQIEAFKSIDVEKYEIVATLDLHTSEICQEMDGKVFNISDQEIGVTVPPFHSHCRTVIAPYFDDDEPTRASKDENGEYKEVKYMNYKEWKDQYIKKENGVLFANDNGKFNYKDKINEFYWLEKIDKVNYNRVREVFSKYEIGMAKLNYETAIVVRADGNVYGVIGGKNFVNSQVVGDLTGAYITHNHPIGETEFSFSFEDVNSFINNKLTYLKGLDQEYEYELSWDLFESDPQPPENLMTFENTQNFRIYEYTKKYNIRYRRFKRKTYE